MANLSRRERTLAMVFYVTTSVATIIWWGCLIWVPDCRPFFLGREFSQKWMWLLLAPDLLSALVMSTLMLWALANSPKLSVMLGWTHFGAQGYAWAISVGLAWFDPSAYWGVVAMTLSTGIALAFAIRIQGINILWGAFRFRAAKEASAAEHWRRSLVQTAGMWGVFLVILPTSMASVETALAWNAHWITTPSRWIAAALVFGLATALGLWAGKAMTRSGEGTPLPSEGTRKLVRDGPYRLIRNPMALAGISQGFSVGLAIGSPLIMVYSLVGGVWWDVLVRHLEETYLESQFGDDFRSYASAVPCWRVRLPRGPGK